MTHQADKLKSRADKNQSSFSYLFHSKWGLAIMTALVGLLIFLSLYTGVYDLSGDGKGMFWITRLPRTISLVLSGATMALTGLVMQLLTQNKFSEPTTTGTIEWAGLGLVLVYVLMPNPTIWQRMMGAVVFAFIGSSIFFAFMSQIRLKSSLIVPIVGMMLGAVISAISNFVALTFQASQVLTIWFTGSFANVQKGRYELIWLLILVVILIYLFADRLTIVGLGEDIAVNLGINYQAMMLVGVTIVSLATGVVAAVVGYLPFIGLMVPNLVSRLAGDDLRSNLPWVALLGMASLITGDLLSRTLVQPFEIPVSLILGVVGSSLFIAILWRRDG